jgi:hypothetical protein
MDLKQRKAELLIASGAYFDAVYRGSKFIKIALVIVRAAAATVALVVDIAHANEEVSSWTITGLVGAFLVALGSIYDAIRETDASKAIALANRTIEDISEREQEFRI